MTSLKNAIKAMRQQEAEDSEDIKPEEVTTIHPLANFVCLIV
jgi:hypothetical protein